MLRLEVGGLDEVIEAVKKFPGALNPFIKKAVKEAMKPVLKAAKALCPRPKVRAKKGEVAAYGQTGLLRKSLGLKVAVVNKPGGKTPAAKGSVIGMVGPRKSVQGSARSAWTGRIVKVWPVKYAHLVEFGHRFRSKSGKGKVVKGAFFLSGAMRQEGGQVRARLVQGLKDAVAKAAAKIQAKARAKR